MLYAERKRLATLAEAEALGESFWTDQLDGYVRGKLVDAWSQCVDAGGPREMIESAIMRQVQRETGNLSPMQVQVALLHGQVDDVLSYIEGVYGTTFAARQEYAPEHYRDEFWSARVNEIFNSHRISFRLVDGAIVPLSSDELHVEVVVPALRLLHGRKDFKNAHEAYIKALKEISNNDAPDAITDASTALQEALLALGCEGKVLGKLLTSAKAKGLLGKHDQKLVQSVEGFIDWAAAERNDSGDAHKSSPAQLADAWLMVHVVGALIVRLADATPRHP